MAAAALPLLAVAGTGMQIYGQMKADDAQSKQETENALFLQRQAKQAQDATQREADIASAQYDTNYGNQVSAFARAGVDVGSGSPLLALAQARVNQSRELEAIRSDGQLKYDLAASRAQSTLENAQNIQSAKPWQIASTVLTGAMQLGSTLSNVKAK